MLKAFIKAGCKTNIAKEYLLSIQTENQFKDIVEKSKLMTNGKYIG